MSFMKGFVRISVLSHRSLSGPETIEDGVWDSHEPAGYDQTKCQDHALLVSQVIGVLWFYTVQSFWNL